MNFSLCRGEKNTTKVCEGASQPVDNLIHQPASSLTSTAEVWQGEMGFLNGHPSHPQRVRSRSPPPLPPHRLSWSCVSTPQAAGRGPAQPGSSQRAGSRGEARQVGQRSRSNEDRKATWPGPEGLLGGFSQFLGAGGAPAVLRAQRGGPGLPLPCGPPFLFPGNIQPPLPSLTQPGLFGDSARGPALLPFRAKTCRKSLESF